MLGTTLKDEGCREAIELTRLKSGQEGMGDVAVAGLGERVSFCGRGPPPRYFFVSTDSKGVKRADFCKYSFQRS